MNRYYMTADTREALIAESKRLVAARAERAAARSASVVGSAALPDESELFMRRASDRINGSVSDSAFARLVADLQWTPCADSTGLESPAPAVSTPTSTPTLRGFLATLQKELGYGGRSAPSLAPGRMQSAND